MTIVEQACKTLTENGYTCYYKEPAYPRGTDYGFAITPSGNVLYFDRGPYNCEFKVHFQYVPSRETGSGCQALELEGSEDILKFFMLAEIKGAQIARALEAKLYRSPDRWKSEYWDQSLVANPYQVETEEVSA